MLTVMLGRDHAEVVLGEIRGEFVTATPSAVAAGQRV